MTISMTVIKPSSSPRRVTMTIPLHTKLEDEVNKHVGSICTLIDQDGAIMTEHQVSDFDPSHIECRIVNRLLPMMKDLEPGDELACRVQSAAVNAIMWASEVSQHLS